MLMINAPQILLTVPHFSRFSIWGLCKLKQTLEVEWIPHKWAVSLNKNNQCPIKCELCNLCVRHTECRSLELFRFSTICPYLHTCLMREDWRLTRTTVKTTALVISLFAVSSRNLRQKRACTVQSTMYLHNVEILMEFYRRKSIRRTFANVCRCGYSVRREKVRKEYLLDETVFPPTGAPNHGFMFITAVQLTHNSERANTFLLLCPSLSAMHSTYTKSQAQHKMFRFVLREVEEDELLSGGVKSTLEVFSRHLITLRLLKLAFSCS